MIEKSIHQSKEEYIGELSDGKRHGHGLCIYPDGGQYEGDWLMINDTAWGPISTRTAAVLRENGKTA